MASLLQARRPRPRGHVSLVREPRALTSPNFITSSSQTLQLQRMRASLLLHGEPCQNLLTSVLLFVRFVHGAWGLCLAQFFE